MNPKKIRKLLRDPKLFFTDMLHKRLPKKSRFIPRLAKKKGRYSYSVIAAVYGVEKYLDDFFKSLVNQSLDFKTHIQLVMVDDGSLDNSALIIKKWQKKFPENIIYVKKENGGQASARNLGMDYATGDWIAFIDSDDFVDAEYFFEVDKHISRQKNNLLYVSCNFIYFYEDKNQFDDSHPLNYRFIKETVLQINDDENFNQLTVNSVFFNAEKLFRYGIKSNEEIKPIFEDGDFVARLNLLGTGEYISFLPTAKYFYRKRSDASSTLDKSTYDERRYSQLLDLAHINLLSLSEKRGRAPLWLQTTLLYEIFWSIKIILREGHKFNFMTDEFKINYINRLKKIFSYIDDDVVLKYSLAGCWFFHKVGILGFLKDSKPNFSIVYIESWDPVSKLLCVRYFWYGDLPLESIRIGCKDVIPFTSKTMSYDFLGKEFVKEKRIYISIESMTELLTINLNETQARISLMGQQYTSGVKFSQILDVFNSVKVDSKKINVIAKSLRNKVALISNQKKYKNAWIFMDRDTVADDNAEHLYRYVVNNYSKINAFFVLRKSSSDWNRLELEGFNLLDFDSENHKIALLNAEFLISSHIDKYVVDLLDKNEYGDLLKFKYVFLQHGVTKDDLSKWLNGKNIAKFITATQDEYESIVNDGTKYKFSCYEVCLSGFPRHDRLLDYDFERYPAQKKNIVIMPTWRSSLAGSAVGSGNKRSINNNFFNSFYATSWKNLLHSAELKSIAEKIDANIIFYPHVNISPYIDGFEVPSYIEIKKGAGNKSMQHVFVETDVLITDYSSVAFEVAYLKRPVVYYQFDREEIFSGSHTYEKGYFDYGVNGFGPVCLNIEEVTSSLEQYFLHPNGEVWGKYKKIADQTFAFRDGKCCERTFEAIKRLQEPAVMSEEEQIARLRQGAKSANDKGFIQTAINRYQQCFELTGAEEDMNLLIAFLSKVKQYGEVLKLYEEFGEQWSTKTVVQCLDAFVALGHDRYIKDMFDRQPEKQDLFEHAESLLKYSARKQNKQMFADLLELMPEKNKSAEVLNFYLHRDWDSVRASMRFSSSGLSLDHFDLFLQACFSTDCVAYAEQVFSDMSAEMNPAVTEIYAARLQFAAGDFEDALQAYENLRETMIDTLSVEDIENWLKLRQYQNIKPLLSAETGIKLLNRFSNNSEISSFVVQQAELTVEDDFNQVMRIFSGRMDSLPSAVSLFMFKNLVFQHRYEDAEGFVLNAASAAVDASDRALIEDFQKMSAGALQLS